MRSIRQRRHSAMLAGILIVALALVLAACGTSAGAGSGSGKQPTSSTPTPVLSASKVGCPSSTVMNTPPAPANIVLKVANNNTVVNAKVGDVIEVDLPFGQAWTGPTASQGSLSLQQPAGFALAPAKVCVWRFTAQSTGTTQLQFYGKAICNKPGVVCPFYIMRLPFTIVVK
jgi:hypothetical protein